MRLCGLPAPGALLMGQTDRCAGSGSPATGSGAGSASPAGGGTRHAGGSNLVTPSFVEVGCSPREIRLSESALTSYLQPVQVTRYDYPDGTSSGSAVYRGKTAAGSAPKLANADDRDRDYDQENASRAKQLVRRYVRTHDLTRLLTFTNGGEGVGFATRAETLDAFARWYKVHGSLLGNSPMLVVAERGGRGRRWHIHAAIRSGYRLDYNRIRNSWSAFLDKRGYHSPTGLHRFNAGDDDGSHSKGFASARVAAAYLAKYITKHADDDDRDKNAHRYRSYNGSAPQPSKSRHASLKAALASLGHCGWVHTLEYVNGDTGEVRPFGFLFDTAPPFKGGG